MKTIRTIGLVIAITSGLGVVGCGTTMPPPDLIAARASYDRAGKGPAQKLDPAELHVARQALDAAERSFAEHGDTQQTRDLAYVAERKASLAEAHARTMAMTQQTAAIVASMHAEEKSAVALTSAELGRTQRELAKKDTQLEGERMRREQAEKRAAKAVADLAAIASVKQEPRGMVITVSGAVLFASNKAELLPGAQAKLNEVVDALLKQDSESKIVVEGYTDSQGAASYNQELSERRAQTVRDYLVSRGIAADRVTSEGFGLTRPIADNKTPEGRANNRRVEIVVQPRSPKP